MIKGKQFILLLLTSISFNSLFSMGWLTLNMQIGSTWKPTIISLEAESDINKKISYETQNVAAELIQQLFLNLQPGVILQPGPFFYYSKQINYRANIDKIGDNNKKKLILEAFNDFESYVIGTVEAVCVPGGQFFAKINTAVSNSYTAAPKDMYYQVAKLGKALGVYLPDIDATWQRFFWRRVVPFALVAGGTYLTYKYWKQIPTIGDAGCALKKSGEKLSAFDTWWKTPRPPKAAKATVTPIPVITPAASAAVVPVPVTAPATPSLTPQ